MMTAAIDAKILTHDQVLKMRAEMREQGKALVHCHGCFDIVHPGHIRLIDVDVVDKFECGEVLRAQLLWDVGPIIALVDVAISAERDQQHVAQRASMA